MRARWWRACAAIGGALLVSLLGACATGTPPGDATGEQLGARFGSCPYAHVDGGDPVVFLSQMEAWRRVTGVAEATREPDGPVREFSSVVHTDRGDLAVRVHTTYWPGIDWALANDATVWFGFDHLTETEPNVSVVLITTGSGEVFFPGECSERSFGGLRDHLGSAALAALPTTDPGQVRALLGLVPTVTADPIPPVLGPDDLGPDALADLATLPLELRLDSGVLYGDGYATVCTRAGEVWDTCVRADEQATTWALVPAVHLDAARALEFWLLDDNADVREPIGYLGTVTAPDDADHLRVTIAIGNINQLTDLARTATGETMYVFLE